MKIEGTPYSQVRKTRWAVRDAETRECLSYRYPTWREARDVLRRFEHTGRVLEVYRTSQSLVTMNPYLR